MYVVTENQSNFFLYRHGERGIRETDGRTSSMVITEWTAIFMADGRDYNQNKVPQVCWEYQRRRKYVSKSEK